MSDRPGFFHFRQEWPLDAPVPFISVILCNMWFGGLHLLPTWLMFQIHLPSTSTEYPCCYYEALLMWATICPIAYNLPNLINIQQFELDFPTPFRGHSRFGCSTSIHICKRLILDDLWHMQVWPFLRARSHALKHMLLTDYNSFSSCCCFKNMCRVSSHLSAVPPLSSSPSLSFILASVSISH